MAATTTDTAGNGSTAPESEVPADVGAKPEPQAPESPAAVEAAAEGKKWPGWPGDSVFRMIVPVLKVGSIIGRKGELIKKLCEETRARVRILDGALGTTDRIVLVSGKEDPDAEISPAMDAVLRIFKRINGVSENVVDATAPSVCSVRLLVASSQAINLIGKQGSSIKSIQESTCATIRVITGDELPFYAAADERVVDIQGEPLKVLKALEAVVGHLRKFLVDHSVIPLFEKSLNTQPAQDHPADSWTDKTQSLIHTAQQTAIGNDYPHSLKRESLYIDREPQLDSQYPRSGLSLYGQDPALSVPRTSAFGRTPGALVTQVTQTMQIPLRYAEDIIGASGRNIALIRRGSGAFITIMETRGVPDELTVEIKGTSTQVHAAQQLVQEYMGQHQEPYPELDTGLRSSYSHLGSTTYPSSSLTSQPLGGYGSSYGGGYGSYRF